MKKQKTAIIYNSEKKLITLKKVKCSQITKRKLRKAARDRITWIKQHVKDLHSGKAGDDFGKDAGKSFHNRSISMIELFFNINSSKLNKKSNVNSR